MTPKIKLCGFTEESHIVCAINNKVDFIGFVFSPTSPRYITPEKYQILSNLIPKKIAKVAVLPNIDLKIIKHIYSLSKPDYFQFHGNETVDFIKKIRIIFPDVKIIKAIKVDKIIDNKLIKSFENHVDFFLFDKLNTDSQKPGIKALEGGNGKSFNWKIMKFLRTRKPWFLSGGINQNNLFKAMEIVNNGFFDISSGIEISPGVKSNEKIEELFKKIRQYPNVINKSS